MRSCQDLVAADRDVGADLEVSPAQLILDLLAALLDPVADRVEAHDLGQAGRRVRAVWLARATRPGQVGDQVPGGPVRQGARVGGGDDQAPDAVRPPSDQLRAGGPPGLGVPVPEDPGHRVPVAGILRPAPGQRPGSLYRGYGRPWPGPRSRGAAAAPSRTAARPPPVRRGTRPDPRTRYPRRPPGT